jgi:hypothetical protein
MSLIHSVIGTLRENGLGLESTSNRLFYPNTVYDNLRARMEESDSVIASSIAATSYTILNATTFTLLIN